MGSSYLLLERIDRPYGSTGPQFCKPVTQSPAASACTGWYQGHSGDGHAWNNSGLPSLGP